MPGYEEVDSIDDNGDVIMKISFDNPSQEEINAQETPFLSACWNIYTRYKLFGLPNNKGYLKEKPSILQIIEICEQTTNAYQAWEYEKNKDSKG